MTNEAFETSKGRLEGGCTEQLPVDPNQKLTGLSNLRFQATSGSAVTNPNRTFDLTAARMLAIRSSNPIPAESLLR